MDYYKIKFYIIKIDGIKFFCFLLRFYIDMFNINVLFFLF